MYRFISALLLALISASASADEIYFSNDSWQTLLERATKQEKLIFVDVYTEWCGPCKTMAKEVFTKAYVADFYNQNFINVKLDAEDEDMNGPELAGHYQVSAYPTLLIIDGNGDVRARHKGAMDAGTLVEFGRETLGQTQGYDKLLAAYQAGNRSTELVRQYLTKSLFRMNALNRKERNAFSKSLNAAAQNYFSSTPLNQLINREDFFLITRFFGNAQRGNTLIEFIVDNRAEYESVADAGELATFLTKINDNSILSLARTGDMKYQSLLDDIKDTLKSSYDRRSGDKRNAEHWHKLLTADSTAAYARKQKNWETYIDANKQKLAINKEHTRASDYIKPVSLILGYAGMDQDLLKQVEGIALAGYQNFLGRSTASNYARVLARLGKTEQAQPVLEHAMQLTQEVLDTPHLANPGSEEVKELQYWLKGETPEIKPTTLAEGKMRVRGRRP